MVVDRMPAHQPRYNQADTERVLLELQADVLALVDETLIRSESVDARKIVTPTTRRDPVGARLRRSVVFGVVKR
jgi:hypothetical protein